MNVNGIEVEVNLGKSFSWAVLIWTSFIIDCNDNGHLKQPDSSVKDGLFVTVNEGRIAHDGGLSRGIAWGDYDNDGDPDLYVANSNGQWNAFYRNDGKGKFKKMTANTGEPPSVSETVIHGGRSEGVNWVDFDNDNDLDLFVLSRGPGSNLLFENIDGQGFVRVENSPLTEEGISASMACWADIEGDGDLDVLLVDYGEGANHVFRNNYGVFERVEDVAMVEGEGRGRACACGDANDDGLPEFYVGNAMRPNFYYVNKGNWEFDRITEGHLVEDVGYSYGISWADYDADGDLDLFVANFNKENYLYNNDGKGQFTPITEGVLAEEKGGASKGHTWGDYDNDGDIDLFIANGTYKPDMRNFLFLNRGDGSFDKVESGIITTHSDTSAGAAHADFDLDGDLDIFVANWGSQDQVNRFYQNTTEGQNWLAIQLTGKTSNRRGIGSKVTVVSSDSQTQNRQHRWVYPVTGYGSQNDYLLHFGLGKHSSVDSLLIRWTSGVRDVILNTEYNRTIQIEEIERQ